MTALLHTLTPPPTRFWELKECTQWTMKLKKVRLKECNLKLKECNQKMMDCTTKNCLRSKKVILSNPPNANYSNKRSTRHSIRQNSLIIGSNELYSVTKSYANIFDAIETFVKPTSPKNIITNETILTQYSINQGLNFFCKKVEATV